MHPLKLLMWGLVGWSALGGVGISVSLIRGERTKVIRGLMWLVGVWVLYIGVLISTSLIQPQRMLSTGEQQCFDEMCFTVMGARENAGFLIHDGSRLIQVSVRVTNKGRNKFQGDEKVRAYLVDDQGRQWGQSRGINGVGLNAKVPAGGSVMSEPVFKVAKNASGLGVVFTRGWRQPSVLIIGDPDSWMHRRTVVMLRTDKDGGR